MDDNCQNCRSPNASLRSMPASNGPESVVFLCESCHGALDQQFVWGATATN